MIDFRATPAELLEQGRRLRAIRFSGKEAVCFKCNEPVAWIAADPKTLELVYVEPTTPGARPLNLCRRHRG